MKPIRLASALLAGGPYMNSSHTSGAPFMQFHRMSGHSSEARIGIRVTLSLATNKGLAQRDYSCHDKARIGFSGRDDSSPPAIREKASLMVSVVFFAEMWRRRVAFEAV